MTQNIKFNVVLKIILQYRAPLKSFQEEKEETIEIFKYSLRDCRKD